jgi:hypothetical protein
MYRVLVDLAIRHDHGEVLVVIAHQIGEFDFR